MKNSEKQYSYEYPRPALTVDCVVFAYDEGELRVLLIKRGEEPFLGAWALPGGFVHMDEDLDTAAARELEEETGVKKVFLEQLYTFGAVDRDPRGRVVTVAYYALVKLTNYKLHASTDASDAAWFSVHDLPSLAFDHQYIFDVAFKRLQAKITYEPIGFELLPNKFTLTQLQRLYETILEREIDKRNFRKRLLAMDIVEELDEVEQDVAHRAARLYRFDRSSYKRYLKEGFEFNL